ncbi:unnamed protein product [Periconia digitata]|uniref:DUF7082 domain-containing protein n=1 Tax=Periconia digitata TaxID=1303443 RepID=A0A9W4XSK7_9PLEO|nr:unnamed protein product [Periconia digitata]
MSGYDKSQEPYSYDAETTRPNQVATYAGITQPSFASQYTDAHTRSSHELATQGLPLVPSSPFSSRGAGAYQAEPSFIDARSRHPAAPPITESEITKYVTPSQGTAGSTVLLHIRSKENLTIPYQQPSFSLMFGTKKCPTALQKMDPDDEFYNYALSVEVPPFPLTNSWDPTMMLKLQMEDKNGRLFNEIDAGRFTFTDMSPGLTYHPSPELVKKRKFSSDFSDGQEYSENATKRNNSIRFQAKPRSVSNAYSTSSMSPLPTQSSLTNTYGYGGGYDYSKPGSYTPPMSAKGLYALPSNTNLGQADMKPPQISPSLPSYGSYSSMSHTGKNSSISKPAVLPSSSSLLPTPVLVRATTVSQASSAPAGQPFNPYLMYPTKAALKIEGDLDTMTENWTREEQETRRRLVEFKRSQHGSTISTKFAPITLEARPPRSICISCIWWQEKNEYFITSVDTIYLLEQLVNVRFTVEEKNRIRRNLEGFRPLTVSKAKEDSTEFFKVIMGFPNPKPRNIEKDVKVFPWKILSHALKKIISKYTANYSSTAAAGSLPAGSHSSYVPVGVSQSAGDGHRNTSPRSTASSTASTAYTPILSSTSLSPNLKASAGLGGGSSGHGLAGMTPWRGGTHGQVAQYTPGHGQTGRESWDYGYMNASAAPGVPGAAHSMQQMQRSNVTADQSQVLADNPYQAYGQHTTRI